jgi:hypothetical protein
VPPPAVRGELALLDPAHERGKLGRRLAILSITHIFLISYGYLLHIVPVFSSHRDRAQRPFQTIGIHRDVRIGEEDFEAKSAVADIRKRLGKRITRQ